jgi:hypothetical protein
MHGLVAAAAADRGPFAAAGDPCLEGQAHNDQNERVKQNHSQCVWAGVRVIAGCIVNLPSRKPPYAPKFLLWMTKFAFPRAPI